MRILRDHVYTEPGPNRAHKVCAQCGQDFYIPVSWAKKKRFDKFCTKSCGNDFRMELKKERERDCEQCGNTFIPRGYQIKVGQGRFCSQSCSSKNSDYFGNNPPTEEMKKKRLDTMRKNGTELVGPKHPRWKGGVTIDDGYVAVRLSPGKYKHQHRMVMENHLGRKLSSDEIVHHINGDRSDNRIENLQVMSRAEHMNEHREDIQAGRWPE